MKKFILLIFILITSVSIPELNAQSKLAKDIVGIWKPLKIYDLGAVVPEGSQKQIEEAQKRFFNSKFDFKADHNFSFNCGYKEVDFKDVHWKILPDNGQIVIQEWRDKDKEGPVLMGITVLKKDGKVIFMLEESFFAFEMKKVSE
ncbi:MAG TPA: hypothetical protein VF691_01605 [Cytophagaceae bacterium]